MDPDRFLALGYTLEGRAAQGESDEGAWFASGPDGRAVVVKVLPGRDRRRIEALAAALDALRARGCAVPRYGPLLVDGDSLVAVQERLPGRTDVATNERTVADILAMNHRQVGVAGPPTFTGESWGEFMVHTLTVGEDGWAEHGSLQGWSPRTAAIAERVETIGATADPALFPTDGIVHLDLHPGNFLFHDDGSIAGVVDWEGAMGGDPRFDLTSFAFCHATASGDAALTEPVWRHLETTVEPRVLRAYAAHQALRLVDWMIRKHTPAEVDLWCGAAEDLLDRYDG